MPLLYFVPEKHSATEVQTGAVGYAHDARMDHAVRIFELVCADEYPVRVLLKELMRLSRSYNFV